MLSARQTNHWASANGSESLEMNSVASSGKNAVPPRDYLHQAKAPEPEAFLVALSLGGLFLILMASLACKLWIG